MVMKKIIHHLLLLIMIVTIVSCGKTDERLAESRSSKLNGVYHFFNDVRLDIIELEPQYNRLENFAIETKKFLESKKSQELYEVAGLYFEKRLNREKGAIEYEDRFLADGMVLHLIVFPPKEELAWKNALGDRKGKGKQVGVNFIYYQTFTAQPTDEILEKKINKIIEQNIEKHAADLSGSI